MKATWQCLAAYLEPDEAPEVTTARVAACEEDGEELPIAVRKKQKTPAAVRMRMAAYLEPDEAPEATTAGALVCQEHGDELSCPSSSPSHWQMVWCPDRDLCEDSMSAGYSFTVPSLPGAAPAMPSDIVRFVELVHGDAGRHFIHNVALHMLNVNLVFFNRRNTGEWRPGKWTWLKEEAEVITLRFAWKDGIRAKTTSFKRNALGWYVSYQHVRACEAKVLYLLPATNTAESQDPISTWIGGGNAA